MTEPHDRSTAGECYSLLLLSAGDQVRLRLGLLDEPEDGPLVTIGEELVEELAALAIASQHDGITRS